MTVPGSSPLTTEQSDWFAANHGVRYLAVQDNADVMSRKKRRDAKRRRRRRPDGKEFGG